MTVRSRVHGSGPWQQRVDGGGGGGTQGKRDENKRLQRMEIMVPWEVSGCSLEEFANEFQLINLILIEKKKCFFVSYAINSVAG
jgi:hypothetical protein